MSAAPPVASRPFVVVGAGLGGALMATLLARAGHRVIVLERRADVRRGATESGRSINLAISARGLQALAQVGLEADALRLGIPLRGRMIHPVRGPLAFQPYGAHGQAINSVARADLNRLLLDAAERAGAEIQFGRRAVGVDPARGQVTSVDAASGGERTDAGTVVGADGAYSVVRTSLEHRDRHDYSQSYLGHGYKELIIPPGPGGSHVLEKHALHIWPRGGFMMMAMANLDGSFTVTLYLPWEGTSGFAALETPDAVRPFFQSEFPDAIPLLPTLERDFFTHPTGSLVTVRNGSWHEGDRAVLLGDAAHAIVPFFGQGANAAFEDCLALDAALRRRPDDRSAAFAAYEAERRPNAEAIADLALANFREMRDHVGSPLFRMEKRGERLLHRLFPSWFVPLYTMISFSLIPYVEARRRARRQARVVRVMLVGLGLAAVVILGVLLR
ncbi:MAG: FAD-dependent oxidoreductase [Gemmatimonadales bacterium]